MLRDLSSTNGTFVNRKRVTVATLQEGDIVHFAEFEFRVGRQTSDGEAALEKRPKRGTSALGQLELSRQFVGGHAGAHRASGARAYPPSSFSPSSPCPKKTLSLTRSSVVDSTTISPKTPWSFSGSPRPMATRRS